LLSERISDRLALGDKHEQIAEIYLTEAERTLNLYRAVDAAARDEIDTGVSMTPRTDPPEGRGS
jgi:hypothetical protein